MNPATELKNKIEEIGKDIQVQINNLAITYKKLNELYVKIGWVEMKIEE